MNKFPINDNCLCSRMTMANCSFLQIHLQYTQIIIIQTWIFVVATIRNLCIREFLFAFHSQNSSFDFIAAFHMAPLVKSIKYLSAIWSDVYRLADAVRNNHSIKLHAWTNRNFIYVASSISKKQRNLFCSRVTRRKKAFLFLEQKLAPWFIQRLKLTTWFHSWRSQWTPKY